MNIYKLQETENQLNNGDNFDLWYNVFCPYKIYNAPNNAAFDTVINYELENNIPLVNSLVSNMTATTSDGHPCLASAVTLPLHLGEDWLSERDIYIKDYAGGLTPRAQYKVWDGATKSLVNFGTKVHIGRVYFVGMFYSMPRYSTAWSTDINMSFLPGMGFNLFNPDPSLIPPTVKQIEEINGANVPGYYDDGVPTTVTVYKNSYQYERCNIKRGMPIDDGNTVTYTVTKHMGSGIDKGPSIYIANRGPTIENPAYFRLDIFPLAMPTTGPVIGSIPSDYILGFRVYQPIAPPTGYAFPQLEKFFVNGGVGDFQPDDPTLPRLCYRGFIVLGD